MNVFLALQKADISPGREIQADLQQYELKEARLESKATQTGVGLQAGDIPTARSQQVCEVSTELFGNLHSPALNIQ